MTHPDHATPCGAQRLRALPELLAPAGDWECARAAVENGADAIYFGLEKFNARMRARNFTVKDLPDLMKWLHRRGVRGYLTVNTLLFPAELEEAEALLRASIESGVDAAIVQDVGLCRLIRRLSPDFPIHASTQMTITSPAGAAFARELGCSLAVLARECSLQEIAAVKAADPLPLEVFVHGALCVAYSGQCLTSEALGGRSANRGECAQACRLPYELLADGQPVDLGDRRYLLSPQDLAGLAVVPDLIRSGVTSLKIEGRLKSPEYVANITRVYRRALDQETPSPAAPEPESEYDMEMAFSRGLYTGWFRGIDNQSLVHGRFGKKRGVYLGRVESVRQGKVWLRLEGPLKPGDGLVFDAGQPDQPEEGGRVTSVESAGDQTGIRFHGDALDLNRVHPGQRVWKTSDPELDRRIRQTYAGDQPRHRRPISMRVTGTAGEPLRIFARDGAGLEVEVASGVRLEPAIRHAQDPGQLRRQLGRLGGTPFELEQLDCAIDPGLMLPVSELNRVRREAVEHLERARLQATKWTLAEGGVAAGVLTDRADPMTSTALKEGDTSLNVLVRTQQQLEALLEETGWQAVYLEFENPRRYREAVVRFRESHPAGTTIWLAPPRIFKPGEDWILKLLKETEPDGFLVRNFDHLKAFKGLRCRGDFSLNVANGLAAEYFIARCGLESVTASYDLNAAQVEDLLISAPPAWFEITLHQHMPMFHMEHCVFCAFLSDGKDYHDCGRPCEKREVRLRDRVGESHPLRADAGCRNTLYHARAQTGAEFVEAFRHQGARRFRIEFLDECPAAMQATYQSYRALLEGRLDGRRLWRDLKLINQLGVTRGQLAGAPAR